MERLLTWTIHKTLLVIIVISGVLLIYSGRWMPTINVHAAINETDWILQALKNKEEYIDVSTFTDTSQANLRKLYNSVLYDHPELYYVTTDMKYSMNSSKKILRIYPSYQEELSDDQFQNGVQEAMSTIDSNMTELEKVVILHDWIATHCEYDSNGDENEWNAYGVFVDKRAACRGYVMAYKHLLDLAGIESYVAESFEMSHAWNVVKIGDKFYHVDVTWDDPSIVLQGGPSEGMDFYGRVSHKHLLLTDKSLLTSTDGETYSNWEIMSTKKVECKATDGTYENAFWTQVVAPIIIDNHNFYYIDNTTPISVIDWSMTLKSIPTNSVCSEPVLVKKLPYWNFTGLSYIGHKLLFNDSYCIYAIDMNDFSISKLETIGSDKNKLYGMMCEQGSLAGEIVVNYQISTSNTITKQNRKIRLPASETKITSITMNISQLELGLSGVGTLSAIVTPDGADISDLTWETSDASVASVDFRKGSSVATIKPIGTGSCVITVASGTHKATCEVKVTEAAEKQLKAPIFSGTTGTTNCGDEIFIKAESGAKIYYTTDGTEPSRKSTLYTGCITITEQMKAIKAFACADGYQDSPIAVLQISTGKIASEPTVEYSIGDGKLIQEYAVYEDIPVQMLIKLPNEEELNSYEKYQLSVISTDAESITFDRITSMTIQDTDGNICQLSEKDYDIKQSERGFTISVEDLRSFIKELPGASMKVMYTCHLNESAKEPNEYNKMSVSVEYPKDSLCQTMLKTTDTSVFITTNHIEMTFYKESKKSENIRPDILMHVYEDAACTKEISFCKKESVYYPILNNSQHSQAMNLITDEKGQLKIHGLKSGTYFIKEDSVPDGYKESVTSISVQTNATCNVIVDTYEKNGKLYVKSRNYGIQFTRSKIQDFGKQIDGMADIVLKSAQEDSPYLTPETGGKGDGILYIIGAILFMTGGLLKTRSSINKAMA